ncbi:hypothetical protein ACJMK2_036604 [Sinanodonta woodiana]|uniref:Uncharacterized protein n=1 Tax=Sinanodonta woodiana TaxID=1069815 RepID=A0ABD3WHQ6_SINWO
MTREMGSRFDNRLSRKDQMLVEEGKMQKLLDFIDSRCQRQRFRLHRQITETQQIAEDTQEKKNRMAIELLTNYFQVSNGRLNTKQINDAHEERLLGVMSEPAFLPSVPEIDPDILSAPRSMYDKVTSAFYSHRLPAMTENALVKQMYTDGSSGRTTPKHEDKDFTPKTTPPQTPPHPSSPVKARFTRADNRPLERNEKFNGNERFSSPERNNISEQEPESGQERSKPGSPERLRSPDKHGKHERGRNKRLESPQRKQRLLSRDQVDIQFNSVLEKVRPSHKVEVVVGNEEAVHRLGDGESKRRSRLSGRYSKLSMSGSVLSLPDISTTRKQKAAMKLRTALKAVKLN